jgi:hypothetical protein
VTRVSFLAIDFTKNLSGTRLKTTMTSTVGTRRLISTCAYLALLTDAELQVVHAQNRRNFSESAAAVDGGTAQRFGDSELPSLVDLSDTSYELQRREDLTKMLARKAEASVREPVSLGAGDGFEACTDM